MIRGILFLCALTIFPGWAASGQERVDPDPPSATIDSARLAESTVDGKDFEAEFHLFLAEEQRKKLSRFRYMLLGYGLIWICLGFYLFGMNRRIHQVGREVNDLKGRLEDARRSVAR